jgi:hypothetical protein
MSIRCIEYGFYAVKDAIPGLPEGSNRMPCKYNQVSFDAIDQAFGRGTKKAYWIRTLLFFCRSKRVWCGVSWDNLVTYTFSDKEFRQLTKVIGEMVSDGLVMMLHYRQNNGALINLVLRWWNAIFHNPEEKIVLMTPKLVKKLRELTVKSGESLDESRYDEEL